jgi:hypothetical protein
VQVKLLRLLIEKIFAKINENVNDQSKQDINSEAYFELLSAHKELIELLES